MNTYLIKAIVAIVVISAISCRKEKVNVYAPPGSIRNIEILLTPITEPSKSILLLTNTGGDTIHIQNTGNQVTDFRKWDIGGKTYYSYFQRSTEVYQIPNIPYSAGYRIVTDVNFKELKRLKLQSYAGIDAGAQPGVENHDFLMLGEDHFITLSYYAKIADNIPSELKPAAGLKIATPVIQETKSGTVVWQWVGGDYPELYETSIESNDYSNTSVASDYLHVNSMWIDPKDNNLVISCRNSNQVLKLDRHGKDILWQLGGINSDFTMPEGMQFLRQHNVTYINDGRTLLLLDNGDINERNFSRVLEFDLDEANKTIIAARAFVIPERFIRFGGSVQKFGELYFIGCGSSPYVMEINSRTKIKTFEMKLELGSYRAFKYESY